MEVKRKGKNRVTIKEVAKASGVSIATVSYVLNNTPGQSISEDTRKKVLQFANILGYECNIMAKYLATGKTNTVSAVIKEIPPLAAEYYMQLLCELSRLLARRNISLTVTDYADGMNHVCAPCDAYITIALTEKEFHTFADTKYVPVLAIDSVFDDFLFYRINDDYRSMYESAKRYFGEYPVELLTFALPDECIATASCFDNVTVVDNFSDIASLDHGKRYVTVSGLIAAQCPTEIVKSENASYAFKASAAAEAAVKAIAHVKASSAEHNILI